MEDVQAVGDLSQVDKGLLQFARGQWQAAEEETETSRQCDEITRRDVLESVWQHRIVAIDSGLRRPQAQQSGNE